MPGRKKGVLTVSGEWARHLRPDGRRAFWSGERKAAQSHIVSEMDAGLPLRNKKKGAQQPESSVKPARPSTAGGRGKRSKP
jgi:hypothetical protein